MSKYKNNLNYDRWGNPTYDYLDSKEHTSSDIQTVLQGLGLSSGQASAVTQEISNRWGFYGVNTITEIEDSEDESKRLTDINAQFKSMITKRCRMLYEKYKYIIGAYNTINQDLIKQGVVYHSDITRKPDFVYTSNSTEYALPNSKVNNIKGNPTDFNENERRETGMEKHETNTQGGVNLIDQTLKYIRGMKISWIDDFVEELKPCFCTLYL